MHVHSTRVLGVLSVCVLEAQIKPFLCTRLEGAAGLAAWCRPACGSSEGWS